MFVHTAMFIENRLCISKCLLKKYDLFSRFSKKFKTHDFKSSKKLLQLFCETKIISKNFQ